MSELNSYDLSRSWFDWCFENPDKIKPAHTALYFFCIEHCNRLGWKDKFGLPTQMAMEALGIKNWRTYSSTFEDLVEFGFIEVKERSKNQWSATIIAIVKNTKANTKALSKATQKHSQKQSSSIAVIDKPINLEPNNLEQYSKSNRFITPTIEEIKNYCLERNNKVDADKFFDFYSSKGWMIGKNKMKDWRAAVRTWEKDNSNNTSNAHKKVNHSASDLERELAERAAAFLGSRNQK